MRQTPLLFLSDSPSLPTGLGRITKDLAVQASRIPELRVGTMGRGGGYSSRLPFPQYNFDERDQWGEDHIERVWKDFARGSNGVVMTIWDPSRLGWFAKPRMGGRLEEFLKLGWFKRWGYMPVDSYGIGGKLGGLMRETLGGFDRVLAYTIFGKQVLEETLQKPVEWAPHGFDGDVFKPGEKISGRMALGVAEEDVVVGCVMTNQARKDWATALGTIAWLKNAIPNLKLWAHIDTPVRYWDLYALVEDFGLGGSVVVTYSGQYNSKQLAVMYSACDVTMLPSLGEGFGYPIIESLACGVPVIHGAFGGGAELVPTREWLVEPEMERLDGMWNLVRPVWDPKRWAGKLQEVLEGIDENTGKFCRESVAHLEWQALWPGVWEKWFKEGIAK